MAAYAAVVSVMNTMNAVMDDHRLSTCFDKKQIQSLGEKLDVVLQFIVKYDSLGRDDDVESLERRISSAAHAAEDVIERHIVDQIQAGVLEKKAPTFMLDLQQTIHGIDLIKEEAVKVQEEKGGTNCEQPKYSRSAAASSSQPPLITTGKKTAMVGFDDYLLQLLDGLTGHNSGRLVIPIVGMGGVGKTTLTRNGYENSFIVQHFHVRAWVSISQEYDVKNILMQLLSTLGQQPTQEKNVGELSECLHKYLFGRRYLIVLDDMWSIKAWDKIRNCFPDNFNGSRIIVSTRLLEVANELGSSRVVRVGLLDESKSWELFCDKAFAQHESCPAELEEIGRRIVEKCNGLPLSIVVIGAFLGKSSRDTEYWENIAENISSILSSGEENGCLDILCLSYNNLPAHLKPCFLYLGIFREDHEIYVSQLIKLWVSEGFIKSNKDQRLEEVGEGYINDLFERSLILVHSVGWNRKLESFLIHDIVRELCLREALKEKFFCVVETLDEPQGIESERCIVVNRGVVEEHGRSFGNLSVARSLICEWEREPWLSGSTLLRVLVVGNVDVNLDNTVKYFEQVNMRFITNNSNKTYNPSCVGELPRSIFLLWNLQTLIFSEIRLESEAPVEIWKLPQLRHIVFLSMRLPEPAPVSDDEEFILHNLQTLMTVVNWRCSEEACKRIPNIRRLHLSYEKEFSQSDYYCLENVGRLNKLEALSFYFEEVPDRDHLVQNLELPASLKELSLTGCGLQWDDDMSIVSSLLNLQFLELGWNSFVGKEWKCVEVEFLCLKHLLIGSVDLKKWDAESSHFPVLETLVLYHLLELEEIPSGIGDIPTLTCIRLEYCCDSLNLSAMKILEEQESLGNDGLQIQLRFWKKEQQKDFMELVELEGVTCSNITMNSYWW